MRSYWVLRKDKFYYDRHAKPLKGLELEERVRVKGNGSSWASAVVTDKWSIPRSYVVKTESGNTLRRNRRHLMKVPEPSSSLESEEESMPSATLTPEHTTVKPPGDPQQPQNFLFFPLSLRQDCKLQGVAELSSLLICLIYEHLACVQASVKNYVFFSFCANIDI